MAALCASPGCASRRLTSLGVSTATRTSKRLENIYKEDKAYTVRGAALESLALNKAPEAEATLEAALATSSPDNILRRDALRAMGSLGDKNVAPALLEWSSPGKPSESRGIAIGSLGRTDLTNHEITERLISYLNEPSFDIKFATVFALGRRGDPAAISQVTCSERPALIGVPHAVED